MKTRQKCPGDICLAIVISSEGTVVVPPLVISSEGA